MSVVWERVVELSRQTMREETRLSERKVEAVVSPEKLIFSEPGPIFPNISKSPPYPPR